MSIHISRPRRLPRGWVMVLAATAGAALGAAWFGLDPPGADPALSVPPAPRTHAAVAPGPAPGSAPALAPLPVVRTTLRARSTPPLSAMVSPGVHITPLGVPAGTLPEPAGPRPHDSEPEN